MKILEDFLTAQLYAPKRRFWKPSERFRMRFTWEALFNDLFWDSSTHALEKCFEKANFHASRQQKALFCVHRILIYVFHTHFVLGAKVRLFCSPKC